MAGFTAEAHGWQTRSENKNVFEHEVPRKMFGSVRLVNKEDTTPKYKSVSILRARGFGGSVMENVWTISEFHGAYSKAKWKINNYLKTPETDERAQRIRHATRSPKLEDVVVLSRGVV